MKSRVTIRKIAAEVGLSHTTVSLALRNDPRILPATRRKIRKAANLLGYRRDAFLSSLMVHLRTIRDHHQEAALGFVTAWPTRKGWEGMANIRRYHVGVSKRASELGYKLDDFWLTAPDMTPQRMTNILLARGIQGLVLASLPVPNGRLSLGWEHFACVAKGLTIAHPALHRVLSSHYEDMQLVLERLTALGYHRIGLVLSEAISHRVNGAWLAGYLVYQNELPGYHRVPPLILTGSALADQFRRWFKTSRPDVLLFSDQPIPDWIRQMGLRVPSEIGLVNLDWSPEHAPMAGLDSEPESLGAAAVDLLVGQLEAHEFGLPLHEKIVTIKGSWVSGTTIRRLS